MLPLELFDRISFAGGGIVQQYDERLRAGGVATVTDQQIRQTYRYSLAPFLRTFVSIICDAC